jgi:hypothetical protein
MKVVTKLSVLVVAILFARPYAAAEELAGIIEEAAAGDSDHWICASDCGQCQSCSCECRGELFAEFEATFLTYHRADGVRFGADLNENVDFDLAFAPRFTVGYVSGNGLGTRFRYWDFDESEDGLDGSLQVDALSIDWELMQSVDITSQTMLEVSAGLRYNEFGERMTDIDGGLSEVRTNLFSGIGGLLGMEVRRRTFAGELYAGVKGAIVFGDAKRQNVFTPLVELNDTVNSMTELGLGYKYHRCIGNSILTARVGVEWQMWYDYSSSFDFVLGEDDWDGTSNVGFGGLVLGLGWVY